MKRIAATRTEQGVKRKSLRKKISLPIIALVAASLILVGGIASWLNYRSTFVTLDQTMTQTATIAAGRVEHQLKEYANVAVETGCVNRLASMDTPLSEKQAILNQRVNSYDFVNAGILDLNGQDLFTYSQHGQDEFFQESKTGVYHISEPFVWENSNEMVFVVAAPLWENGAPQTQVVGVLYFLAPVNLLSDIVNSIHISSGGSAYIVDQEGYTIAHGDISRVEKRENMFEVAKQTPALAPLSDIHKQMVAGKNGFATYSFSGVEKFIAYAPVAGTHGWSIAVNAPMKDFMNETVYSIIIVIIMLVGFVILSCFIAYRLASGISRPMAEMAGVARQLSNGDFRAEIHHRSQDEMGELADCMRDLCGTVVGVLQGMQDELSAMRDGDFTGEAKAPELYIGDFAGLRNSVDTIRSGLHHTLTQINTAAEQVAAGADQVASGAQALSLGATEQASSIEELAATIADISNQVVQSADNAHSAREQTETAGVEVSKSNQHMQEMMDAMRDISGKSAEISKIIKTIEDIAFQTNILALNAAVEAARAGTAGKGFAVVADEVRNLAGKSSVAAKNTTVLIEETVRAVENGTRIADNTAQAMLGVVDGAQAVAVLITEIAESSGQQATSIAQVNTGLDQISNVVHTNSATAEESAAASEELSGQASMLKGLVGRFRLQRENTAASAAESWNGAQQDNRTHSKY